VLRTLSSLAVVLLLTCVASRAARADEVFVLDNGMVLRGTALKQTEAGVVIRLADFAEDARVTVEPSRIVRRFASSTSGRSTAPPSAMSRATDRPGAFDAPTAATSLPSTGFVPSVAPPLPLEEPAPQQESFFARSFRLALLALPSQSGPRAALTGLVFLAIAVLVLLGGGLLEIEGLTMLRATLVASAFGGFLLADLLAADELLRADRAVWVLPLQAGAWSLFTWVTVRCSPAKVVLLLAFLGFSMCVLVFTAGAVLLSF
jgi:hypothetical protein